jgi:glutamate synthase domain-containing protein 2
MKVVSFFSDLGLWGWAAVSIGFLFLLVLIHDVFFAKENILKNFPVLGHLRYLLIEIGPELRQYIVANNREEQPFNRGEREWIYRSSKGENNYFGFGTDDQIYGIGYPIIKNSAFPFGEVSYSGSKDDANCSIPCAKVMGEFRDRPKAWRPKSIINISAMSFGSLSANSIESLNRGAKLSECYHNTGEGGISPHHQHGADLVWQIGTGKFGCRDLAGNFSMDQLLLNVEKA